MTGSTIASDEMAVAVPRPKLAVAVLVTTVSAAVLAGTSGTRVTTRMTMRSPGPTTPSGVLVMVPKLKVAVVPAALIAAALPTLISELVSEPPDVALKLVLPPIEWTVAETKLSTLAPLGSRSTMLSGMLPSGSTATISKVAVSPICTCGLASLSIEVVISVFVSVTPVIGRVAVTLGSLMMTRSPGWLPGSVEYSVTRAVLTRAEPAATVLPTVAVNVTMMLPPAARLSAVTVMVPAVSVAAAFTAPAEVTLTMPMLVKPSPIRSLSIIRMSKAVVVLSVAGLVSASV